MLYFLFLIIFGNSCLSAELPSNLPEHKLQENGFRWKRGLDIKYQNYTLPINDEHIKLLKHLENSKKLFNAFASTNPEFSKTPKLWKRISPPPYSRLEYYNRKW